MLILFLACDGLNAERGETDKPQDTALPADTAECTDPTVWYADADADGFGSALFSLSACEQPEHYVLDATDCDDTEETVSPTSPEYCDGVDQNCNGEIDEGASADAPNWYADTDTDGFGDATDSVAACAMPAGYVQLATDCDDARADANPAAPEVCNGLDDDCDAFADDNPTNPAT